MNSRRALAPAKLYSPPISLGLLRGVCVFVQAASEGLPLPQSEAAAELQTPASAERLLARPDEVRGLINLDVVVTDNSGKPVPGLKPRDFSLLDNGQPQKISQACSSGCGRRCSVWA